MAEQTGATTHVLIFCQEESQRELFDSLFSISGLTAETLTKGEAVLAFLQSHPVDVILLSTGKTPEGILEQIKALKAPGSAGRDIPVVLVLPEGTPTEIGVHGLHAGAYDYLIEPFNEIELLTKVTVLAQVKHAEDEFRKLAIRDTLTGLYDRRYLFMRACEELSRAKRYSKPIAFVMLDIDQFAAFNQQYGTDAGDHLLQQAADAIGRCKREIDVLARFEADKFALVLYNTDNIGASVLASRIAQRVGDLRIEYDDSYQPLISIGITAVEANPELTVHAQELQHQAELALVRAKRSGGNRIVVYTSEMAKDLLQ